MKKLLTLVLALVLVFAIAAPALAITGDVTAPTTGAGAPVAIDTTMLVAPAGTVGGFGGFSLTPVAAAKLYVVNEMAYFCVAVKFNEESSLQIGDYSGSTLTITSDAIKLDTVFTANGFDSTGTVVNTWVPAMAPHATKANTFVSSAPADAEYLTTNVYYIVGQGLVTAKGVVKATFGKTAVSPVVIYTSTGAVKYSVAEAAGLFTVTKGNPAVGTVTFAVDANEEVTSIQVNAREVEYKKIISGGGSVVASIGDVESGAQFDTDLALYNEVMGFFGFNYDAEGILQLKHFASKAATLNLKDESAVTLYTGSLVIPGGADVPKTGDAASIMGFVMITLAMVAAGFVVSRKVRA